MELGETRRVAVVEPLEDPVPREEERELEADAAEEECAPLTTPSR
jgi:hypothetical protein